MYFYVKRKFLRLFTSLAAGVILNQPTSPHLYIPVVLKSQTLQKSNYITVWCPSDCIFLPVHLNYVEVMQYLQRLTHMRNANK